MVEFFSVVLPTSSPSYNTTYYYIHLTVFFPGQPG